MSSSEVNRKIQDGDDMRDTSVAPPAVVVPTKGSRGSIIGHYLQPHLASTPRPLMSVTPPVMNVCPT